MKPLALAALLWAVAMVLVVWSWPAASQDIRPRMTLVEPGGPGCFADIVIVDLVGVYNEDVPLETSLGTVVVRYTTLTSHADPDMAEVMSLPPNVLAEPLSLRLTPSQASRVCLMEWQGM